MYILLKRSFLIIGVCLLAGCYEDTFELTLHADGSGVIKQKLVASERFMVAFEDAEGSSKGPLADKEQIIKTIGDSVKIKTIKQEDMPDGSRVIEFEATFARPEQFFLSDYCQDQLKLRIAPVGEGKAAIYCDMAMSGGMSMSTSQIYAAAKGLLISRIIHVPGKIQKANGDYSSFKQTVKWSADLRDKKALEQTMVFLEGPDNGKGFVVFDASGISFDLPLKAGQLPRRKDKTETPQRDAGNLTAEVVWVSVTKKASVADGKTEISDLEIGVKVQWDQDNRPFSCQQPVLLSLSDDMGTNLVKDAGSSNFSRKIFSHEKSKELKVKANMPVRQATKLQHLEGYVEVICERATEVVELTGIRELIGKESTGNEVLDKLNFRIKALAGNSLKITITGGKNVIVSVDMLRDDGSKIRRSGSMSTGNTVHYDFTDNIAEADRFRIEVVVSQKKVKVPFSFDEIPLP